jgi:hypothetical protein
VLDVDRHHHSAFAVGDAEAGVVPFHDHSVPSGERDFADLELQRDHCACTAEASTRAAVEVGDVSAAAGDHHRVELKGRRVPVGDELLARRLRGRGNVDALVLDVLLDRVLGTSIAEQIERPPLPRLALAAVLRQLDRESAPYQRPEAASRLELR